MAVDDDPAVIGRSIIENDAFEMRVVLGEDGIDGRADISTIVPVDEDEADDGRPKLGGGPPGQAEPDLGRRGDLRDAYLLIGPAVKNPPPFGLVGRYPASRTFTVRRSIHIRLPFTPPLRKGLET
ncbi:hypothetical protein [Kaistia nematophila]|uniref:Uncharacterized protein n=1 Tax=Kaistia nematophila TaxID=2994654 RepID=A0A9X3E264_9HYPH|nr:hypothetical protein [Kaistia nematophila]